MKYQDIIKTSLVKRKYFKKHLYRSDFLIFPQFIKSNLKKIIPPGTLEQNHDTSTSILVDDSEMSYIYPVYIRYMSYL